MIARFKVILPEGRERELDDVQDVVAALQAGEIVDTTMLFDDRIGRWVRAGEHDLVLAERSRNETVGVEEPEEAAGTHRDLHASTDDRDPGVGSEAAAHSEESDELLLRLQSYIGRNWESHYRGTFEALLKEELEPGFSAGWTWNWAAALVPVWFLYRRLYAAFFGFALLYFVIDVVDSSAAGSAQGGSPFALLFIGQLIFMGWAGDRLLFRKALQAVWEVPSSNDETYWVCTKCGTELAPDTVTCPGCGEDVREIEEDVSESVDRDPSASRRPSMGLGHAAGIGLVSIVIFMGVRGYSSLSPESEPIAGFAPNELAELSSSELSILAGLCESAGIQGAVECNEHLWELGMAGIMRLSDQHLIRRARILEAGMARLHPRACAAAADGIIDGEELQQLFARLDKEDQVAFTNLYLQAAVRQSLGRMFIRTVSDAEAELAFRTVYDHLSPSDAERLWNSVQGPSAATDADLCWSGRLLYRMTWELPNPHGANLARLYAGIP